MSGGITGTPKGAEVGPRLLGATYVVTTNSHRHGGVLISIIFSVAVYVVVALGAFGTYKKAGANGEPAWSAFVPVYNWIVLLRIVGRSKNWAWFLLLLVPSLVLPVLGLITSLAFFVVYVIVVNDLSKSFGHGPGFTVGLAFVIFPIVIAIFWYILWLGQSQYRGPSGPSGLDLAGSGSYGSPGAAYPPAGQPVRPPTGQPGYPPAPQGYPPAGQAPPPPMPGHPPAGTPSAPAPGYPPAGQAPSPPMPPPYPPGQAPPPPDPGQMPPPQ